MTRKPYAELRSARWMVPDDQRSFGHRSRTMQMGYDPVDWEGRPIIAILNTWSDAQPCHMHFKDRVEWVKRGILQAGGFPMELPALSLSENFVKPTTMLYRNLLAMETEELLRSHPVDGAVLMGGCDKTTPGLVMGATSMGLPFVFLPAGPMLRGNYAGRALGSGTDGFKYWDERRAGTISQGGVAGDRGRHRPLLRPLHDDGHGLDDDRDRRGDGPHAARRLVDPGRRRRPPADVDPVRAAHRRDGLGGPDAGEDHHARRRRPTP